MLNSKSIYRSARAFLRLLILYYYRRRIPKLVKKVREKEIIKVLFVLSDVSLWKTEGLYLTMLRHPRFEPIIGTTLITADLASEAIRKYNNLIEYLDKAGYQHVEIYFGNMRIINPDIIFYQQPYDGFISEDISYYKQALRGALICNIPYFMNTLAIKNIYKWVIDLELHRYCWQMYVENKITAGVGKLSILKGKNIRITGMPIQDVLSQPKEKFNNPWIKQETNKKRIIFAPHHSIPGKESLMNLSRFLDVADIMISLATKYKDSVQFAFKPHPFLRKRLVGEWGAKKTNAYYHFWEEAENTQLCEGEYLDLFKYSDAMIHDCDSFTLEYCYVKKPVMFLVSEEGTKIREEDLNDFGKMAFDLHDKGDNAEAIEQFIQSVIRDEDNKKERRECFYKNYLLPPNRKSASDNIIEAILKG